MAVRSAGKLDVLVVVQEQSASDHTLYTDCTGGEIWINLRPLTSHERFLAQATEDRTTHIATSRYWPGLTGQHRFKRRDDGRIIELMGRPREVERRAWFEVDVAETDDPDV
jgi:head-tail adaptor